MVSVNRAPPSGLRAIPISASRAQATSQGNGRTRRHDGLGPRRWRRHRRSPLSAIGRGLADSFPALSHAVEATGAVAGAGVGAVTRTAPSGRPVISSVGVDCDTSTKARPARGRGQAKTPKQSAARLRSPNRFHSSTRQSRELERRLWPRIREDCGTQRGRETSHWCDSPTGPCRRIGPRRLWRHRREQRRRRPGSHQHGGGHGTEVRA